MVTSSDLTKNTEQNTIHQFKDSNPWIKIGKNAKYVPKKRYRVSSQRVQKNPKSNFEVKLSNKFSALEKVEGSNKHKRYSVNQQNVPKQKLRSSKVVHGDSLFHVLDWPIHHRSMLFFTLDSLEEKIRFVYLMKYA